MDSIKMNFEYLYRKNLTLTKQYKKYLHLTEYETNTYKHNAYVVDTLDTFCKRNDIDLTGEVEEKSFDFSSGVATWKGYGEKYQLTNPTFSINNQNYKQYTLLIENPNEVNITLKCQNFDQDYEIEAGKSILIDQLWSKASTVAESVTYSYYCEAYNCISTSATTFTAVKDIEVKKEFDYAPVIYDNGWDYTKAAIKVTNKNDYSVTYYDRDINDAGYVDIEAGGSVYYYHDWTQSMYIEESHTFSGYFSKSGYVDSDVSSLTVTKEAYVKPTIPYAPVYEENNNTYDQCTVKITNNNSYSVTLYDRDLSTNPEIAAGKSYTYDYAWTNDKYTSESHTFSGYFAKSGYNSSDTGKVTIDKPVYVKTKIPYSPVISISNNTYTGYTVLVQNPNAYTCTFYSQDLDGSLTITSGSFKSFSVSWSSTQTSHTVSGYFSATDHYDSDTGYSESATRPSKPTLSKPSIEEHSNTYTQLGLRYVNNASVTVTMTIDGTDYTVASGGYKDILYSWYSYSTMTKSCTVSADNYNSNSASETFTRPSLPKLTAPSLSINNNTYDNVQFNIYNPNSTSCSCYDTGGNLLTTIDAYKSDDITYTYTGNSKTLSCYFMGDSTTCLDSSLSSITASRPDKPVLSAPIMSYAKGTGVYKTKYKVTISNGNSTNVSCTYSGPDVDSYTVNINANSYTYFYVDVISTGSRTYEATFSASGYDTVSSSLTIN